MRNHLQVREIYGRNSARFTLTYCGIKKHFLSLQRRTTKNDGSGGIQISEH